MKNITMPVVVDNKEWFGRWFDSSFYHKLYADRDEKEAAGFIDALVKELQPPPQTEMLDLGCGNGRHSKYLASKGFNVIGIDLATSSIREAKRSENPSLRFYRRDMRIPFGKKCFNYVFNFFTSFGYFKTSEEDHQVIGNMSAALKTGGILVLDYINSAYAEKKIIPEERKEIDGIVYHISRHNDKEHFFKKIAIEDVGFGNRPEYIEQVRKFSPGDFEQMFNKHHLQVQQVYGDYQLNSYDKQSSPRLILIARKITE